MTEISVVICTYKRQQELALCLDALVDQSEQPLEVLVVDNEVSDETRKNVANYESSLPLKYVEEPNVGLSNARRTGWRTARGDVVAYIDDDGLAATDYVTSLRAAFDRMPNSVVCVGGRISLAWPEVKPPWVAPWMESFYSALDLGDAARLMEPSEFAWGCNMAFRKSFLESEDAFNSALGRTGSVLLSGEDTEIQKVALDKGLERWYEPKAAVVHMVGPERVEPRWLRRRMLWEAISEAMIDRFESRLTLAERLRMALKLVRGREVRLVRGIRSAVRNRKSTEPFLDVVVISTVGYVWGMIRNLPEVPAAVGEVQ